MCNKRKELGQVKHKYAHTEHELNILETEEMMSITIQRFLKI